MNNVRLKLADARISELSPLIWHERRLSLTISLLVLTLVLPTEAWAKGKLNQDSLRLEVGGAGRLSLEAGGTSGASWASSAPQIAQVFQNGFVVGLMPGQSRVRVQEAGSDEAAECVVTVEAVQPVLLDPATLKQFPDNRAFVVDGRKCYGSELNGQRTSSPEERRFVHSNRVINPNPPRKDKPLEWELQPDTEVYDGAGVLMGTVPPREKIGDRRVPVSMLNFGMSKVLRGRICLYAFAVAINPSPAVAKLMNLSDSGGGVVETSAWLPLDRVVAGEILLERIGLGKTKLPALPLESKGHRITGGDPKLYLTEFGEMSIVRDVSSGPSAPRPSHYLRRPSGTINLLYSVPGFGLGGQGTDSFLLSDALVFYPAKGVRAFRQPTYFPFKHPQAGQVSPQTMTFLYGAIISKGSEPSYGWLAKQALADSPGL